MKFEHVPNMIHDDPLGNPAAPPGPPAPGWRVKHKHTSVYRISCLPRFQPYTMKSGGVWAQAICLVHRDTSVFRAKDDYVYPYFKVYASIAETFVIRDILKKLEGLSHKGYEYLGLKRARQAIREVALTYGGLCNGQSMRYINGKNMFVVVDEAALQQRMEDD